MCVCVCVHDDEGVCHQNPAWLTDVFLIVSGQHCRSMAQGSKIKENISGSECEEISCYHSDYALLMEFADSEEDIEYR